MNELINRIVVALIGIPIGIYVIWYGSWLFFLAVLIISSLALYEFNSMVKLKELKPFFWINLITLISVLIFTFYVMMIDFSSIRYYLVTKSASILLSYFILYFIIIFISTLFSRRQNPILSFSVTIGTLFYVLLPFVSLIILRLYNFGSINYKNSWQLILSYFFTIWICDTFAYFVGKKWGNHKIAPAISPKKKLGRRNSRFDGSNNFFYSIQQSVLFRHWIGKFIVFRNNYRYLWTDWGFSRIQF